MLWTNGETETSGVAVVEDPTVEPVLAMLDGDTTDDEQPMDTPDNQRSPWPWADLSEAGPVVVLDARDADEEEGGEEEEDEEDADFFDDEEEEDDDLDDDLEDEDLEDEEFEDEDEDDEEEEEDDDF